MARILILLLTLVTMPLFAADLSDSYAKLFQMQVQLAQSGNASALYSLGEMHEQGMGTPVNIEDAFKWYEKAAVKGDMRAKHKMASRASIISKRERTKQTILKAHKDKLNRAAVAKKRARAKAALKRQRARALADDMEDQ
ncbi:MAG: hypothetical protein V3S12_04075 [Acidiferrobacterales bacterium]